MLPSVEFSIKPRPRQKVIGQAFTPFGDTIFVLLHPRKLTNVPSKGTISIGNTSEPTSGFQGTFVNLPGSMSFVLWQWRRRWFAKQNFWGFQVAGGSRLMLRCFFPPKSVSKIRGFHMVSLCLSNIPKVWWSELSGLVDFCLFLVGGKAGVWVESHHLRRLHQKTLRAAMTLQKKLSSAHSIRSWPSSEGTTWDPPAPNSQQLCGVS